MDFSRIGAVEVDGAAYCAHANPKIGGKNFHIRGPYRPDEEAAKEDLQSMRAAASGKSREDGFAAMKAEADALKAGKPPKEVGFVERDGNSFRASVKFRAQGAIQHVPGPLRAPPRCARYVPFFGFALSTCPLGCFRAGGAATRCWRP